MTEQPPDSAQHDSQVDFGRLLPFIALACAVVFGLFVYFSSRAKQGELEGQLSEQTASNTQLQQQLANLESVMSELQTAKVYEQQEKSIAAVNALAIVERGEVLRQEITLLRSNQERLTERIQELEQSDDGRRIASDATLVQQVAAALDVQLPPSDLANRLLPRVDQLLVAPNQALEKQIADYLPSDSLLTVFDSIEAETASANATVSRVLNDLDALVRQASNLPLSQESTLQDQLMNVREGLEGERRALVAETIDRAKRDTAQKLADQEAENERKIAEATRAAAELVGEETAARILAQAAAEKQRMEVEKQEREVAAARAKLDADFKRDEPQIKNLLVALVSSGGTYLGNKATQNGPVSISVLQSRGILTEGRKGIENLCFLASNNNDRPRGPLPFYDGNYSWWDKVDKEIPGKAQALLIRYADLMLEKGLLSE